jgi:NAD(P)-dependent dehydrogenase (short-subunit alcohol dehydrogenase family)
LTVAPSNADRAVVVSGATSGIGRGCAERLVAEGARVWALGSRQETVERLRAELPGLAGASACDVADEAAVAAAFGELRETLGSLDGAFVNAGIDGEGKPAIELDADNFRRVLDVNVVGAFLVAREAVRLIEGEGAVVFNASVNAIKPELHFADYNASKAAVASLAQTMALELAPRGISVVALCPGYVETPMSAQTLRDPESAAQVLAEVPLGRVAQPSELAVLVSFLLSPESSYMTGSLVNFDGGRSV